MSCDPHPSISCQLFLNYSYIIKNERKTNHFKLNKQPNSYIILKQHNQCNHNKMFVELHK